MGDNRVEKNLHEGAGQCNYAIVILSKNTVKSRCACEEIQILEKRYKRNEVIIFPVFYELSPNNIPEHFEWLKKLIFKEVNRLSGSRDICNHIACKVTDDIKSTYKIQSIQDPLNLNIDLIPKITYSLLESYKMVDAKNLNCRITLLYAMYLSLRLETNCNAPEVKLTSKIFERLFSETKLDISIDYREIWLLENSMCIIIENYIMSCAESSI